MLYLDNDNLHICGAFQFTKYFYKHFSSPGSPMGMAKQVFLLPKKETGSQKGYLITSTAVR